MMQLAFYKGARPGWHGVCNRLIRWWTRSPYSHVELVFSDGMSASSSAEDGGVRLKKIDFDPANWDFVPLSRGWSSAWSEQQCRGWFIRHQRQKYDYRGLVRCVVPPAFNRDTPKKWFCSESVVAAFGFATPWRFKPCDVYAIFVCPLFFKKAPKKAHKWAKNE